jgi:hypothetical protein
MAFSWMARQIRRVAGPTNCRQLRIAPEVGGEVWVTEWQNSRKSNTSAATGSNAATTQSGHPQSPDVVNPVKLVGEGPQSLLMLGVVVCEHVLRQCQGTHDALVVFASALGQGSGRDIDAACAPSTMRTT